MCKTEISKTYLFDHIGKLKFNKVGRRSIDRAKKLIFSLLICNLYQKVMTVKSTITLKLNYCQDGARGDKKPVPPTKFVWLLKNSVAFAINHHN